jgi:hypothetical protein
VKQSRRICQKSSGELIKSGLIESYPEMKPESGTEPAVDYHPSIAIV